jgi:protein arginine N-methyltransferase 1
VRAFSTFGRWLDGLRAWIRARPAWAAWFYPDAATASQTRYRDFNGWYFAHFCEQERMLADRPRMAFYHAAIARHIQPGDRVVDLGTGTGILAALAARRGAAKVYAIDHSAILKHARTLAAHNRVENVEFIATHSREFTAGAPVDVILHEQMGDCLFDEEMVANVCDLRERVLRPGGLILPSRFEFFCEPVSLRAERQVPFLWELNVHGYDYGCLEWNRPQEPGYYRLQGGDLGLVDHFLGEPEPALEIDLHTVTEAGLPTEVRFMRTVVRPGPLDGFAVYFRVRVDGDLSLTSSPLDPGRAPHWGFRILRAAREDVRRGEVIEIRLQVGRWPDLDSWRWSHRTRPAEKPEPGEALGPKPAGSAELPR